MAAYQRAKWVEIGACSCIRPVYRGCVSLHCVSACIWLKLLFQITCYILRNWIKYGVWQRLRRSDVLWDNLSARIIHNNHKLAPLKQCDYYELRSQNISKNFHELLQGVAAHSSFSLLFIPVSSWVHGGQRSIFYNEDWAAAGEYFSAGSNRYSECFTWNILLWVIRIWYRIIAKNTVLWYIVVEGKSIMALRFFLSRSASRTDIENPGEIPLRGLL